MSYSSFEDSAAVHAHPHPPKCPRAGTNTFIVTHLPNIEYAFGDRQASIDEGEALVVRPDGRNGNPGRTDQDRRVAAARGPALSQKSFGDVRPAVDLAATPFVATMAEVCHGENDEWRVRPGKLRQRQRNRRGRHGAGRRRRPSRRWCWSRRARVRGCTTAIGARKTWRADGPHFLGHIINHVVLDPRDGRTLLAAAKTGHLGPTVFRSTDLGRTWKEAARPPAFAKAANGEKGRTVDHTFWLTPGARERARTSGTRAPRRRVCSARRTAA